MFVCNWEITNLDRKLARLKNSNMPKDSTWQQRDTNPETLHPDSVVKAILPL